MMTKPQILNGVHLKGFFGFFSLAVTLSPVSLLSLSFPSALSRSGVVPFRPCGDGLSLGLSRSVCVSAIDLTQRSGDSTL
jgi:hypothetical protein